MEDVSYNLSSRARAMLAYIADRGGGIIEEHEICTALELSHGYFSAARSELVAANLLILRRQGRKPYYLLLTQTKPEPQAAPKAGQADGGRAAYDAAPRARRRGGRGARLAEMDTGSPRIDGEFPSRTDWIIALTNSLGDVEVEDGDSGSDDGEEEAIVTILGTDEIQRYTVIDDDGGFIVT